MTAANQSERPEVGKYPLLFGSNNYPGLEIIIFRIGPREENQFVLKLTGIDHAWDGHFFELTRDGDEHRANYAINSYPDGEYNLVTCRDIWGGSSYEIYIKGIRDGIKLFLGNGSFLIAEHLLTEFLAYKEKGEKPF